MVTNLVVLTLFIVDLCAISLIAERFLLVNNREMDRKNDLKKAKAISFISLWALRLLIYHYILLIPFNKSTLNVVTVIFLALPTLYVLVTFDLKIIFFRASKYFKRNLFAPILLFILALLLMAAGETSWDGSSYHFPMELMIKESGSLWNWPDLIYSQWQLSGIESVFAFFNIGLNSNRIALVISLFLFLMLVYIFQLLIPKYRLVVSLALLSVPALFHQIGTRYIDMIIAILSFLSIIALLESKISHYFKFGRYWTAFPMCALAFSGKWSAITSEIAAFSFILVLSWSKKNDLITIIKQVLTIVFAALAGLIPSSLRNWISWDNPLYPYQFLGFEQGYFSLSSYSLDLESMYASQLGLEDNSHFIQIMMQYLTSPFHAILEIFRNFVNLDFATLMSKEIIYRTFVYDNRWSGFGPITLILIALVIFSKSIKKFKKIQFGLLIVILSLLPSFIHSRYYLTFCLVIMWFVFSETQPDKHLSSNLVFKLSTVILLIFTVANFTTSLYRMFPSGLGIYALDQNTNKNAQKINPDCSEVFHIGSGLWGTTALWGSSFCGKPVEGENVNGMLFKSKIGPRVVSKEMLLKIENFVESDKHITRRIVCSFPKDQNNPCDAVYAKLANNKNITINRSGSFSEVFGGPTLESLSVVINPLPVR